MESSLVCLTGVDELYVGTESMHKEGTVRRREATERVDLTFLNSVPARPWDGPKKVRDVLIVLPDLSSPAAMPEAEAIGKGRRLYISKADIMKHGLTEGCLGCRCLAERKRAQGHSEGCRARLEAEIAKTEDGRARLATAYLRSLPRDEGREPDAGAEAPAAVPEPPRPDGVQDEPMDARGSVEGNVVQKMLVMKEMTQVVEVHSPIQDRWLATACPSSGGRPRRSEPVLCAPTEACSSTSRQRAGAFGLSAGVARIFVWDGIWGSEPTRSTPRTG